MIIRSLLFLGFILAIAESSQASTYLEQSCPDSITGQVLKIEDKDEVDHIMAKVAVTIELEDSLEEKVRFNYPKFAINQFKVGENYQVGMRKGKVCFVERVL